MTLAPLVAFHLLASVQGQMTNQEAQEYNKAQTEKAKPGESTDVKKIQGQFMVNGHKPRTCDDKCQVLKKLGEGCETAAKQQGGNGKACHQQTDDMAKVCEDSCREKGKVDPEYIKTHMKKPQAPPGAHTGPKPAGMDDSSDP